MNNDNAVTIPDDIVDLFRTLYVAWKHGDLLDPDDQAKIEAIVGPEDE